MENHSRAIDAFGLLLGKRRLGSTSPDMVFVSLGHIRRSQIITSTILRTDNFISNIFSNESYIRIQLEA